MDRRRERERAAVRVARHGLPEACRARRGYQLHTQPSSSRNCSLSMQRPMHRGPISLVFLQPSSPILTHPHPSPPLLCQLSSSLLSSSKPACHVRHDPLPTEPATHRSSHGAGKRASQDRHHSHPLYLVHRSFDMWDLELPFASCGWLRSLWGMISRGMPIRFPWLPLRAASHLACHACI